MAKKGDYQIPFNKAGDQLHYAYPGRTGDHYGVANAWIDNFEFEDTLEYVGYTRGRSSAYFEFKRTDGGKVCMFLTDFEDVIRKLVEGRITDKFTFTKRGQNYGVRLV